MEFEAPQYEVERQVDEIFEDVSHMSAELRLDTATFDLLEHIEEERDANNDLLLAWLEAGKGKPRRIRRFLSVAGFVNMGFGFAFPVEEVMPAEPQKEANSDHVAITQEEIAAKELRLENARMQLVGAKAMLSSIYSLTQRQVKIVEARAKRLKAPNQQ